MQLIHVVMFLLWRGLPGYSVSTTTHASNVSKRQLQFGPLSYTAYAPDGSQQTNAFMQSPQLLYDPGYNSQESHELSTNVVNTTDTASTGVTEQRDEERARDARKFDTLPNDGVGAPPAQAAQTFSHIYFPHMYATSAMPTLARTAPHIFPGETPAALAARNSGRSYSTSSTYFVPLSVLYHPNVGPYGQQQQQPHPFVYPQQQMTQAYNPLPPPPLAPTVFYQQNALPPRPQPSPTTALTTPPLHQAQAPAREPSPSQALSEQAVYQQHAQHVAHIHTSHFPPLPPLSSRVPEQLPRTSPSTPLTQHFQAPFHPSQFLGFVPERDTRNGGRIDVPASPYIQSAVSYSQQQQQQQQRLAKPIYERSLDAKTGVDKQQNYQTAVTPQTPYVYMAPNSGYALFKAA